MGNSPGASSCIQGFEEHDVFADDLRENACRVYKLPQTSFMDMYNVGPIAGHGHYSTVYQCCPKWCPTERYALKVLKIPQIARCEDQQIVPKITREISIMKKLKGNDSIVELIDMEEKLPQSINILLEWCDGGELFYRIQRKHHYSETEANGVIYNILIGIQYMHSKRIMHRDLKPENIMLTSKMSDIDIKIADFGFAKPYPRWSTTFHTFCGTPHYAAPELLNREEYGPMVDMWAMGVVAYLISCGSMPFFSENLQVLYQKILKRELAFFGQPWQQTSQAARDFIDELLQVDPSSRMTADQALNHQWILDP